MFGLDSGQLITYLFIVFAIIIALASLLFSNKLAGELANEERNKIEIWAKATEMIATDADNSDMNLVLQILQKNTTIPVILHDIDNNTYSANNIKLPEKGIEPFLEEKTRQFSRKKNPIVLAELNQYLYYDDSYTLKQLQLYPYVQLGVIAIFIALAFFALRNSLKAQQNKVWVGLSKETAHQLGTPISSLLAWTEFLKLKDVDPEILTEIDKDMHRLEMIAHRFSKIGSVADLCQADLREVVQRSLSYMEKRISSKVNISLIFPDHPVPVSVNEPLFDWVMENLIKNAVDAMGGEGTITISLNGKKDRVMLDISDTGKGIPKSQLKSLFDPGFTTKDRGWGLGLSLTKRIVKDYHRGKIFVKESEIGQGTTFRIILK